MSREQFLEQMRAVPERTALACAGVEISYGALLEAIPRAQQVLQAAGVTPGQAVILNADYGVASIAMLLALYLNRNIVAPVVELNALAADTLRGSAGCAFRVYFPRGEPVVERLAQELSAADAAPPLYQALRDGGQAGLVLLSSGTTGAPKAILHNFDHLLAAKMDKGAKKPTTILMFLLFDHIGGINSLLNSLVVGGCAVLPVARTPDEVCRLIAEHRIKVLPVSPTFLNLILMGRHHEQHDVSSVRLITYGTETMQEALLHRVQAAFPRTKLLQTFGTSETGISTTSSKSSSSTFFKLADNATEYRIVDGELQLKTRSQFMGYLNYGNDNVTSDGWFMTGDLVEEGEDGFIRVKGRSKEMINVGGEKVLPSEVENLLLGSAQVDDCLVYGVPNAITGQCVHADVVAGAFACKKELKQFVLSYLGGRIDAYKIPVKVNKVDAIAFSNRFKRSRVGR